MSKHSRPSKIGGVKKKARYSPEEHRQINRKRWAIAAASLLLALSVIFVACGSVLCQFNYNYVSLDDISNADLGISDNKPKTDDVINIALFGVDTRRSNSFKGLSDTIMILSIDKTNSKIKVTSVMRDSLVEIEGRNPNKINTAYSTGGAKLAIKTLNQNFNLDIREYVTVNFNGMIHVVDELGGITAEVTKAEMKDANKHIKYQARRMGVTPDYIDEPGTQELSGMQAVAWARIRKVKTADGVTDDFGRTDRQRYVIEQLFNKLLKMKKSRYPSLIQTLLPYVETSLSYSDIIELASVLSVTGLNYEQARIPMKDYMISGNFKAGKVTATVYYNLEYASRLLYAFIYDDIDPETYIDTNGVVKEGWY